MFFFCWSRLRVKRLFNFYHYATALRCQSCFISFKVLLCWTLNKNMVKGYYVGKLVLSLIDYLLCWIQTRYQTKKQNKPISLIVIVTFPFLWSRKLSLYQDAQFHRNTKPQQTNQYLFFFWGEGVSFYVSDLVSKSRNKNTYCATYCATFFYCQTRPKVTM